MTARSHQSIRSGLRRIIRDASVSATVRMRAIERLMYLEGLMDLSPRSASTKNLRRVNPTSEANAKRIRELIAMEQEKEAG